MDSLPIQPYYHATSTNVIENDYELLAKKVFGRYSETGWEESRKLSHLPVKHNQLASLRQQLIRPNHAISLTTESGAYVDFSSHIANVVTTYSEQQAFLPPSTTHNNCNFKLSWDNFKTSNENEAWTLTPLSVLHNQRPVHSHLIMHANIPERNINMLRCVVESGLQDAMLDFDGKTFTYQGDEIFINLSLTADWMGHCAELNAPLPNTRSLFDTACWRCGTNKQVLRTNWKQDPFRWYDTLLSTADFPNAIFDEFPLSSRRYCGMHGNANLLSNCLSGLLSLLPSKSPERVKFFAFIQQIKKDWDPTKALSPKQMKTFFNLHFEENLYPLFTKIETTHLVPWPETPYSFPLTTSQALHMLFDSLYIFYHFAYTQHPTKHDFTILYTARHCILACHFIWDWWIAPSVHFMLSHAILDAEIDKTAYTTLQEGVEHTNHEQKEELRITYKATTTPNIPETRSEHLINQQQLRINLIRLGYAVDPYTLTNTITHHEVPTLYALEKPRFAPFHNI